MDNVGLEQQDGGAKDTPVLSPGTENGQSHGTILLLTHEDTTVLQYQTRDLASAFQRLGWKTVTMKDRRMTCLQVHETIEREKPAFVFSICSSRPEFHGSIPESVPFVSWIQDHREKFFKPPLLSGNPIDLMYCMLDHSIADARRAGIPNVGQLQTAVDERLFTEGNVREEYACEVACITNLNIPRIFRHHADMLKECAKKAQGFPLAMGSEFMNVEQTRRLLRDFGIWKVTPDDVVDVAINLPRYWTRVYPVLWAVELGLDVKLWGNGWDLIPKLAPLYRGPIQNGSEGLRDLYRSARINLHSCDMNVHPRVLECVLSGGFVLAQTSKRYKTDKDVPLANWANRREFEEQVLHYSRHSEDRAAVSLKARQHVLLNHTFMSRAKTILRDLGLPYSIDKSAAESQNPIGGTNGVAR